MEKFGQKGAKGDVELPLGSDRRLYAPTKSHPIMDDCKDIIKIGFRPEQLIRPRLPQIYIERVNIERNENEFSKEMK